MRIATFNINNVNKRLENLLAWLDREKPDVICLQELKAEQRDFPIQAIEGAGYHAVWQGQRTWNGVAILSKQEPVLTRRALPGDEKDDQARYIEAAISGIVVACIYLPNGNPQPGPKFDYKLAWTERLISHATALNKEQVPVVIAGDFNIVPNLKVDIYPTRSWDKDALTQPKPRAQFARLLEAGWIDCVRALHPDERIYSYWSYLRQRWEKNGLRLDHLLINAPLQARLRQAGVDSWVRGEEGASDHAPTWIELTAPRSKPPARSSSQKTRRNRSVE